MSVYVIHLEEGIQYTVCVFNTIRPLWISHFRKEGGGERLRQCGVLPDTSVLSTELILLIGHRKLPKLTFGAFAALSQSESRMAWARNVTFRNTSRRPIYKINLVDKTKLSP